MSSAAVYLDHIAIALGERCARVEESEAEGLLVSNARDLRAAGFDRHWLASPGASGFDLAVQAVNQVRGALGEIDLILYSTALPRSASLGDGERFAATGDVRTLMDFPASRLQSHFGLDRAAVIGVAQQACTGLLGALRVGRALLGSEPALRRALCVTADRFPPGARYEQAFNAISDGASACVLSREARGYRMVASHQITNGALAVASDDETAGAFFGYAHRLVRVALENAGPDAKRLRWVVTQNTNRLAWSVLANLLEIDPARFYSPTMQEFGHIISSDCLANLQRLERDESPAAGDLILLFMAGYGANWQCLLLERV